MALQALQIDIPHYRGHMCRVKRFLKQQMHRKMRHIPIAEDDHGGKNCLRATYGWMN